jgi:hypothetical protein
MTATELAPATQQAAGSTTAKGAKQPHPLPAPNNGFYYLYETLTPGELAIVKRARIFMENRVAPVITRYWVKDEFPFDLLPAAKELRIGGLGMKGHRPRNTPEER